MFAAANLEDLGHPYQIRQRSSRHLFHDVATVDLHGDLSEFSFRRATCLFISQL